MPQETKHWSDVLRAIIVWRYQCVSHVVVSHVMNAQAHGSKIGVCTTKDGLQGPHWMWSLLSATARSMRLVSCHIACGVGVGRMRVATMACGPCWMRGTIGSMWELAVLANVVFVV